LDVEIRGDIVVLALNRPEKLNALNTVLLERIRETVEAYTDTGKTLLLTGRGKYYSAGIDLEEVATAPSGEESVRPFKALAATIEAILSYQAPVISYLNGPAIAGGGELALASDIILTHPNAYLAWPEAKWGIAPPLLLGLAVRTGLHGLAMAALTGSKIPADQALAMGVASGQAGDLEEAVSKALGVHKLYTSSQDAYRLMLGELRGWKREAIRKYSETLAELALKADVQGRARRFLESKR